MSWLKKLNPFAKDEAAPAEGAGGMPALPPELANDPKAKGMMGLLYRNMKNPAFLQQMRTLAAHMQKEGVDVKDMAAVKAWVEKNQSRIEKGEFKEPPSSGPKQETVVNTGPDVGRNEYCHCGSGKKFKKCHGK
jgi:preprotein translocase subunit SecA